MAHGSVAQKVEAGPRSSILRLKPLVRVPSRWSTPLALLLLIVAWEIAGRLADAVFFAPFSGVITAWWSLMFSGGLPLALTASLQALLVGFGLALVLGLTLGSLMGLSRSFKYLLDIFVNTLMVAPLVAVIPVIAIFLGLDVWARAAVVFLFAVFVITVNAEAGMKAASPDLIEMARSFGLGQSQIFRVVILPAALPAFMAGIRLGIVRAVKGMVTAELFMSMTGLGALVDYYGSQFQTDKLLAVLLTVVVISMGLGSAVNRVDRRLSRWQLGANRH